MKQSLQIKNSMRLLFWGIAFLLLLNPSKGFGQLLTEDFSYTSSTLLTSNGWTAISGAGTNALTVTGSGLTYSTYQGSGVGNAVSLTTSGEDDSKTFTAVTSGTIYYAAMVNVSAAQATGDYFLSLNGSALNGRLFVKSSGAGYVFGIEKSGTAASYDATVRTFGVTYFIVVKYTYITGTLNDTVSLWINPALGGSEPAATVSGFIGAGADATSLSSISLRQGTAANAATLVVDGIRVGTTWANVTPSVAVPTITGAATATAFTTTYGSPSAFQSFSVSGTNLTANLLATAPTGFEVSSDAGVTYGNTASFTQSSGNASGTLRIRLKATAAVSGSYNSQNIVLSSGSASTVNISTSSTGNAVSPATLTITANNQTVSFGDAVATVLAAGTYTPTGFVNGENSSVISGSVSYTTTYTNTTPASTPGVTISPVVTSLTASNYSFTPANGTITIASAPVPSVTSALTFNAVYGTVASTYTITATNSPTSYSAAGLPSGLSLNTSTGDITGTPTATPGLYNVTISASNAGGASTPQNLAYTITAKSLTITGAVADNKVYDRTNVATISGSTLVGIYNTDAVSVSNTGTFTSSLVANGITVTSTQTLSGADAAKYSLTVPTGLSANITAKALTISGATAQNKQFDSTTTATITGTLSGVVSPDVVTLTLNGVFASAAVANGIAVTSTSTIGGADSGNYTLTQPTGLTANITPAIVPLLQWNTFGNAGTETTEPSTTNDTNIVSATLNYTGSSVTPAGNANRFGGSNWGVGATLSTSNYIQFTVAPTSGYMFTPTSLSFIWDFSGSGPSAVTLRSSADNYTSDIATLTGMTTSTSVFKTLNITGLSDLSTTTFRLYGYGATATSGTGGFDCAATQNNVKFNGYTALAPPPAISTSGTLSALTTVYGTASTTTSFNVSGTYMQAGVLVTPPAGYEVSLSSGSGFASTVTVGASGTISSTPVYVRLKANATVISSPYSGNIVLTSLNATSVNVPTVSSTVTPKTLTVSGLTASNKVFDGNTTAILNGTGSLVGVINSDVVSLDGTPVGTFASSAIGNAIAVNVTGYSISGAGSGNYSLTQPTLSADITSMPSPVITSALTASATYGVVASTYTITATQTPTSYNATGLPSGLSVDTNTGDITGTPTAVPGVYSVTLSATNGGGTGVATLSYTILAKGLTVTGATADNKTYNKSFAATISGSTLVGVVGTDAVSISNTGTFASLDVANGIAVTSTQTLGGADAAKYSLTVPTGLSANITPKALTISGVVAQNKEVDGNTNAVITGTLVVVEAGDVVTLNGTGTFASAAIANGIVVTSTATLGGANAGNYTLTQPTGLTANITPTTLLQWNTFGNTGTETTEPSVSNNIRVAAANLTQGTITPTANSNRFGGSGWFNTGNTAGGNTLTEAIAGNDYMQFVVAPTSGYTFTPTSFSFIWDYSGSGPKSVALRSSADGYASDLGTLTFASTSTSTVRTITISGLTNVSSTTTFRLYGYGATATGGTGGFDTGVNQNNVILYGTSALLTGPTASVISGTNSICDGDVAAISVTMTGGKSPFTVVYTDGTTNFTETNYVSGTSIIVSPLVSSTYTLVSVTDANSLAGTGNTGSAAITLLPNVTYYQDADGDGYGNPAVSQVSCVALTGYVTNATDCNDANAAVHASFPFYLDADHDTYGTGSTVSVCAVDASTPPTGYALNNTDCDDTNSSIYRSALLYTDADGDGYSISSAVTCYGATLPTGTSLSSLGSDCNDANASMHNTYTFYVDADADGYGSVAASAQTLCAANATTPPAANLSSNNTDCDDTKANVHPGAVDVCYDGLDNDCNGNIDNVGQPGGCIPIVTNLVSTTCNTTLASIDSNILANIVSNAQGYRWRVTKVISGTPSTNPADVQYLDTLLRALRLSQLTTFAYNTTYQVEVSVRVNNVWQPYYGSACTVTTPIPTTKISSSQCGATVALMTDVVYADIVPYTSGYRFKVTNLLNQSDVQIIDRPLREFRFNLLSNIQFSTPYKVEVAVKNNVDGTYFPYGLPCTVTTPSFPTSYLQNSQCDYTATNVNEVIYANIVTNATAYRFTITNTSLSYSYTFDRNLRSFVLNSVPGLVGSATYTVQVAVQIGGVFGPYGKSCTLTTPAALNAKVVESTPTLQPTAMEFEAMAVPNPFANDFKLNVKTSSDAPLEVKVYDMLGQLVESKAIATTEIETLALGLSYPSGVYLVMVSQGNTTKTLRVIKR